MKAGQLANRPRCPSCGALLDGFSGAGALPSEGDFTCCVYCGQRLRFRALTDGGFGIDAKTFDELWAEDPQAAGEVERVRRWALKAFASKPFYICKRCGMVSRHPKDIEHRFCARCDAFEEQAP